MISQSFLKESAGTTLLLTQKNKQNLKKTKKLLAMSYFCRTFADEIVRWRA